MKLLIIGGGVFLGKAVVGAALRRGHQVTVFNRGKASAEPLPGVHWIKGDRNEDLGHLRGRQWDAVIDTCGYFPRQVRTLVEAIGADVAHYTFVSSVSAYADLSRPGVAENSPVAPLLDPKEEKVTGESYGPLKGACENAALQSGMGSVLVVRPGIIVGPGDPTGRFAYWLERVARGGEILAPGQAATPLQLIDVDDLATWLVATAERRTAGVFNAVGANPFTWQDLFATSAVAVGARPALTWVSDAFLTRHAVTDWSFLPFFVSTAKPTFAGMFQIDGAAARRQGLSLRPFGETAAATHRWLRERGSGASSGLSPQREGELLAAWHAERT